MSAAGGGRGPDLDGGSSGCADGPEWEDVGSVVSGFAHETVAPGSGVTTRIRRHALRKQSDGHQNTPDLPCGEPPLTRRLAAGRTYAGRAAERRTVVRHIIKRDERS